MTQTTAYEHIVIDERSVAIIEGTNMKVIELVVEMTAYGWSAEELQFHHPYLSLGQIHSALAYYWDHAEDLDRDIERRMERAEHLRTAARPSPLLEKLRARGLV
jgi:uncharacterized protein (DUF433 family)